MLAAVLALAGPAAAQAPDPTLGAWATYVVHARRAGLPVGVHAEVQLRGHRLAGDFDQLVLRTGAQWAAGRAVTLTQGYAFVRSEAAGVPDDPIDEHRLYQEAVVRHPAGPLRLSHRVRLEERWVGGEPVQTRGRYALSATVPLAGRLFAAGSAEAFLRGPGRAGRPVYDRTRLFGGVGVRVGGPLTVQAGYLAQVFSGDVDHQLHLSLHQTLTVGR